MTSKQCTELRELLSGIQRCHCTDMTRMSSLVLCAHIQRLTCPPVRPEQAQVEENLAKQAQVMEVIDRESAAYKQAFGYNEWRAACEVSFAWVNFTFPNRSSISTGCYLTATSFWRLLNHCCTSMSRNDAHDF